MKVKVKIQRRQADASNAAIEFEGVAKLSGPATKDEIASMLLEAEMKGNAGNVRVHIFTEGL